MNVTIGGLEFAAQRLRGPQPGLPISRQQIKQWFARNEIHLAWHCRFCRQFVFRACDDRAQSQHFARARHFQNQHLAVARTRRQLYLARAQQKHSSRILPFHKQSCLGWKCSLMTDRAEYLEYRDRQVAETIVALQFAVRTVFHDFQTVRRIHTSFLLPRLRAPLPPGCVSTPCPRPTQPFNLRLLANHNPLGSTPARLRPLRQIESQRRASVLGAHRRLCLQNSQHSNPRALNVRPNSRIPFSSTAPLPVSTGQSTRPPSERPPRLFCRRS